MCKILYFNTKDELKISFYLRWIWKHALKKHLLIINHLEV